MSEVTRHDGGRDGDGYRRVVVFYLPEEVVFDLMFFNARNLPHRLRVLRSATIPEDVEVVQTCHSWERRAYGIMLRHPSFAPVPEGCLPPEVVCTWEYELVDRDGSEPHAVVTTSTA